MGAEVDSLKKKIMDLRSAALSAVTKQNQAKTDCERLKKDMIEFKNNKAGKTDDLRVCLSILSQQPHMKQVY